MDPHAYRGSRPSTPKRLNSPLSTRLKTIPEASEAPVDPRAPARLFHLPFYKPFSRSSPPDDPPRFSAERRPPSYFTGSEGGSDNSAEKNGSENAGADGTALLPRKLRNDLNRRGGWRRLALLLLLAVAVVAALGAGLGVGLKKHKTVSSTAAAPGSSPPQPFPLGSWTFTTVLQSVSTDCTSNNATWTCYPYETYSSSSTASSAYFNWIITNSTTSTPSHPTYLISSTTSPFTIPFANATLTILDTNTPSERYTFLAPSILKQVWPAVALTADDSRTTCFFNSTVLEATLYTKKPKTYSSSANMTSGAQGFKEWPYAVEVVQTAQGGAEVPNCYRTEDNLVTGSPIVLATEAEGEQCRCLWENYGT